MNKTISIIILVISVIALAASIYVCVVEFTASNVLIAVLLLLVIAYEIWQLRAIAKRGGEQYK